MSTTDEHARGEPIGQPLVMDPMASTVAVARRYVRDVLAELGAEDVEDSAELGVSELVTNALLHARSAFSVSVSTMPSGRVRIGVTDGSTAALRLRHPGESATTGRGLRLVESVSAAWGVEPLPDGEGPGKVVWFEPKAAVTGEGFTTDDWAAEVEGLH